jgi:signal transduction histidine kinase
MFLESTQLELLHAIRRWELSTDPETLLIAETSLAALLESDVHFRQWLILPGSSFLTPGSLSPVCKRLNDQLLILPESLAPGIYQAMHQAIQNRLLRNGFASEVAKAKRDMLYHLAYGLSHEINNPLANISTRSQLLLSMAKTEKEKQFLGQIISQSQRAFEMLGDLMQCAKQPRLQPEWFDPAVLLKTTVESLMHFAQQTIQWHIQIPEQPPLLYSDRDLVATILDILIQNSLDAVGSRGTIAVSLLCQGSHCEFKVQDTGHGLSVEARRHAMDPFYSGRDAGRGIGLGLCKANHFAQALDGQLSIASPLNAGCLATLSLPLSPAPRRHSAGL